MWTLAETHWAHWAILMNGQGLDNLFRGKNNIQGLMLGN